MSLFSYIGVGRWGLVCLATEQVCCSNLATHPRLVAKASNLVADLLELEVYYFWIEVVYFASYHEECLKLMNGGQNLRYESSHEAILAHSCSVGERPDLATYWPHR